MMTRIEHAEIAIKCLKDFIELEKSRKKLITTEMISSVYNLAEASIASTMYHIAEIEKEGETK